MAKTSRSINSLERENPQILIVSGEDISGPAHWLFRWEAKRDNCQRVDLGMWDAPHRNTWVNKLNLAIHRANGPVVLVAHGLGCITVAWWAEYEQPAFCDPVVGALFVAPPDVDRPGRDERLARLGSCPRSELPFPSYLAVSRNDPSCGYRTALSLARDWGSHFADMGEIGPIDAQNNLDDWPEGERLLERLVAANSHSVHSRCRTIVQTAGKLPKNAAGQSPLTDWKRAV
ncbi:MAG: RBBP9/YdeN family alpha/beta hydrolase [Novosphingobium sp.]